MSEIEKASAADGLFSKAGMRLKNIRFFRGSADTIPAADIRAQMHSVAFQRKTDSAVLIGWPKSTRRKVDVRAFVADI